MQLQIIQIGLIMIYQLILQMVQQVLEWKEAHEIADKYNKEGKFTAIYGYEMTWSGSTGGWGHINTFNTPGFETRTNSKMDLKKLL